MGIAGKVVGFGLGAFALGVLGYAVKEAIGEYDKNVEDYNKLVDDCNVLSQFIEDHDFYEKRQGARRNAPLEKVEEFVNDSGQNVKVFEDANSGFKVYEFGKKKGA